MATINLLPWREEFRQEKKKEFIIQLMGVCILALLIAFLWIRSVDNSITAQNQRNSLLQAEIQKLEAQVKEIQELKKRREELIDRMRVIQDLQGTRPIIVRYFDELVRAIPDGIFITGLSREGDIINIEGVTESNNRVSMFMRQLNDSSWFSDPNLKSVVSNSDFGEQASVFSMELKATLPGKLKEGGV